MNKKSIIIIVFAVVLLVSVLWFGGIIPKQIAKVYATNYMKNNFPEMQLEYVDIEWNKYYGDYIISFKDKENQKYACVTGPKYLPISLGQGLNAIMEDYQEKYIKNTNEDNLKEKESQVIETINTTFETYYKMSDGTWQMNGNSYKYRLEISGRMPNAVMDSTYVFLSNIENIPFERAYLAAGLSSSTADYFSVEEAVFVDYFNVE